MATWQEILDQMNSAGPNGQDVVRRQKLVDLSTHTGRPVILYAVEMFDPNKLKLVGGQTSIDLSDKVGFTEVLHDITGNKLDIILHSPGGSPEAAESLVDMVRAKFDDVRFLIPNIAKSAATMMATSGDKIIMGDNAELGPTDPQMVIGGRLFPAHAILQQFDKARNDLSQNNNNISAWLPILQQYGPSLLVQCEDAISLSKTLVKEWLKKHMLSGHPRAGWKAAAISRFLVSQKHLSHGRAIPIADLKAKGMAIERASAVDPVLQEKLQDINFAILHTFDRTGAYKIFDNHLGKGFYRSIAAVRIPQSIPQRVPQP